MLFVVCCNALLVRDVGCCWLLLIVVCGSLHAVACLFVACCFGGLCVVVRGLFCVVCCCLLQFVVCCLVLVV